MSYGITRLTLYALIAAIESDIRSMIASQILSQVSIEAAITAEILAKATERQLKDLSKRDAVSHDLLYYLDFGEEVQILFSNIKLIDANVAKFLRSGGKRIEGLAPIRNRVMHVRPLHFDDTPQVLSLTSALVEAVPYHFPTLVEVKKLLEKDPSAALRYEPHFEKNDTISHNLPIPDFDETGFMARQEELKQLTGICLGPFPVITILGEGGVGKTSLALKLAYDVLEQHSDRFDAVIWASSKTTQLTHTDIRSIEGAIETSLGLFSHLRRHLTYDESQDPISEILSYLAQYRILLILDNLETIIDEAVRGFVSRIPFGSKVLITSRVGLGAYEHPYRLGAFSESDSIQFLRALARIRGVERIVETKNETLGHFVRRMQCNPLFMKWFVSAVQAGSRPEEVLVEPKMFLDFCFSHVYGHTSMEARRLLAAMLSAPGRHSQATLSYLLDIDISTVQKSLNELYASSLITIDSETVGRSYETRYQVSQIARMYLLKAHAVSKEDVEYFLKRRKQLIAAEQEAKAEKRNLYDPRHVEIRSREDLVAAKMIFDAQKAISRGEIDLARACVDRAKTVAPGYFEVYRADAWLQVNEGNLPAALQAYETAVELEPKSAVLHYFFGGFLWRYLDDVERAVEEFTACQKFDPASGEASLELARLYMIAGDFENAWEHLQSARGKANGTGWFARKVYDTYLQFHYRRAELSYGRRDFARASHDLDELRAAFLDLPGGAVDEKILRTVDRASRLTGSVYLALRGTPDEAEMQGLLKWFRENGSQVDGKLEVDGGQRLFGSIKCIVPGKNFGFITGTRGGEFFFHKNHLVDASLWPLLRDGFQVEFRLGENEEGICAVEVGLSDDAL